MSSKQEKIQKMLEMQRQFIAYEHKHGVSPQEYWAPTDTDALAGYPKEFMDIANDVIDLAHAEKGSQR